MNAYLRAAIVGCGQIAGGYDSSSVTQEIRTHAASYLADPRTQLIAVADTKIHHARQFSERWGSPTAYSDVGLMLRQENPAIVSICTPDETHAQLLEQCLACPTIKAVWAEKPLTTDLERAEKIVAAYRQAGILLAVNYQRRWDLRVQRIKEAIAEGKLGQIQKVIVLYNKGIRHNGSHALDLLLDWFGPPVSEHVMDSHIDFNESDPTVDAYLQLGGVPVFLIGLDEREFAIFEIDLIGTRGRLTLKAGEQGFHWSGRCPDQLHTGSWKLGEPEHCGNDLEASPMARALDEIIAATDGRSSVKSSGETALSTLRLCQRILDKTLAQTESIVQPNPDRSI